MTEAEWLTAPDPKPMLEFLYTTSERKLRLIGCGVCRVVWHLFTDDRSRRAVDVAERYADGWASRNEVAEARQAASLALDLAVGGYTTAPRHHRSRAGRCTAWAAHSLMDLQDVANAIAYALDAQRGQCRANRRAGAALVRDIFGNPFRPVTAAPAWLTPTVVALATGIYADRAFDRLPVLADALQDAGCEDAAILDHLRGPGPHVRGCWVVDLILGKT